jgi:hypothetical protein
MRIWRNPELGSAAAIEKLQAEKEAKDRKKD